MFSRAFPGKAAQAAAELAWLDTYQSGGGDVWPPFADHLRWCTALVGLPDSVPGLTFELPGKAKPLVTANVRHAMLYHGTLLMARFFCEELTSLRDPEQATLLRRVVGIIAKERAMPQPDLRKTGAASLWNNWDEGWLDCQFCLGWMVQFERNGITADSVKPVGAAVPHWRRVPGINWPLEHALLDAHIARQQGQYSKARALYKQAQKEHQWKPSVELQESFLDETLLFEDHAPPKAAASASSSSSSVSSPAYYEGTPPQPLF